MSFVPVAAAALELPSACRRRRRAVGVRPEHARLWATTTGCSGPLEGEVAYVEALGRETFLGVRRDGGARFVVWVDGRAGEQPGDRVGFGLVPAGLR